MSAKLSPRTPNSELPHHGPLESHFSAFTLFLHSKGYSAKTLRRKLHITCHFSTWLGNRAINVCDLDELTIKLFCEEHPNNVHIWPGDFTTLCTLLEWLREVDLIPPSLLQTEDCKPCSIEGEFALYLKEERGLSQIAMNRYVSVISSFLNEYTAADPIVFSEINVSDITRFVVSRARTGSRRTAQLMTSALRSFFRFLRYRGEITSDLAAVVPTVADWKQSQIPKHLAHEDVEQLLKCCDQTTTLGKRDYAVLCILARLGLRAGEVVHLTLDDIDWETGVITIHGKGGRIDQLPIPHDVGKALAAYLLHGRPSCNTRRIFIRAEAPLKGFSSSVAICDIVRRALARAGLNPVHKGAHLLRHSLATYMLRQGASLAEIGEILRHLRANTTEIYVKVDLSALSALAQPWPGGET